MSLQTNSSRKYSLVGRLVLSFGILLILFLGLTGLVLDRAFKESTVAAVVERLQLQIYAVLGVAEPEIDPDGGVYFFIPDLEEARFSQIDSGLYAFIFSQTNQEVWRSPSAVDIDLSSISLDMQELTPGQTVFGRAETEQQGPMSYALYSTYWSSLNQEFSFVVMESVAPTDAEISEFQSNLWFWLGGMALVLSFLQAALLSWGMIPLKRLEEDLADIESGKKEQLQEDYPKELQNLSHNLNMLIKSERQRQKRYQTTLGDLAHSLKTPLAVISGVVQQKKLPNQNDLADVAEQVERMNQIVSYQLGRAVRSNDKKVLVRPIAISPILTKVIAALNKVYLDKNVALEVQVDEGALFYGEESDLTELLGNLLDNALKYCEQKVAIHITNKSEILHIQIENDGSSIADHDRHWILERGARADNRDIGQGLGLAIVFDIISSYGGELKVGSSKLGGACFELSLAR